MTGIVLGIAHFFVGALAAGHALLYKRHARAAFGWIIVCFTFPFLGAVIYFFFGVNRVRVRARKLRDRPGETPAPRDPAPPLEDELEPLAHLGFAVSGRPLIGGNRIDTLHNGEQAYPAMLEAIDGARKRLYLSTYIFETNATGRQFVAALERAAARGVDVRVLLDGFGEMYSFPRARWLFRGTGVSLARFLPSRLVPPVLHINLRNHRKILIVDDDVAFTGGINIGDRHLVEAEPTQKRVVDVHFRLRGPITTQLAAVFLHDWRFSTGEAVELPDTDVAPAGRAICRVISDGPDNDLDQLAALLIGAMGIARERIAIMTPYFVPPREILGALQAAALRGVDVAVILPAKNNLPYVHRATRHLLWELIERGVNIYYQPPPFVHSKLFLIDESYAQIGSANLDPRSLRLNFELTVEAYDEALVAELSRHFDAARALSRLVTLDDVDSRPLPTRMLDGVAWLFSPYL
jgi:cardiolipin synthase